MSNCIFKSECGRLVPQSGDLVQATDCGLDGLWRVIDVINKYVSMKNMQTNNRQTIHFFMKEYYSNWKIIKRKNHTVCADCNLLDG